MHTLEQATRMKHTLGGVNHGFLQECTLHINICMYIYVYVYTHARGLDPLACALQKIEQSEGAPGAKRAQRGWGEETGVAEHAYNTGGSSGISAAQQ